MGLYRERIGVSIVTNARTAAPRRLGGGKSARWKGGRHHGGALHLRVAEVIEVERFRASTDRSEE